MSKNDGPRKERVFDKRNDEIRVDVIDGLDDENSIPVRAFFRKLGMPQFFEERIRPTLMHDESRIYAAFRDRPWPPWGLGAHRLHALCVVHPVGEGSVAVSPVFADEEDQTNIGLLAAVHREALEDISRGDATELNYAVIEGSVLADRVLRDNGFTPSDDILLTEEARYNIYRGDVAGLMKGLGLDELSSHELLAHDFDDTVLDRNALFHGAFTLGALPGLLERIGRPEIVLVDLGRFDVSLPGGVGS